MSLTTSSSPTAPDPETLTPERVPWSVLGPEFIRKWGYARGERMPEHVEVLGQNGSGKSFWIVCILLQRQIARGAHIVVIATKPDDSTMHQTGWPVTDSWPPNDPRQTAWIFWPKAHGLSKHEKDEQHRKIFELLSKLWRPNANVIIVFDEVADFTDDPELKAALIKIYREGRSQGITVVGGTQRPQGVPRQMHSEAAWTICFAPKDEEDAERMAQVLGGRKTYMPILKTLSREKYEFLIVHNLTNRMYISWIDHPLPEPPEPRR
jgi:hypothetical protein